MAKISDDVLEVYVAPSKVGGKDSFYGHPGEVIYHNLNETMELAGFNQEEQATYIALCTRLKQVGKELTAKGQSHNNGFFESYFSISGAFDSLQDHFKEGRNEVHVHSRLERDWQAFADKCKVRMTPMPQFSAQVLRAENFTTDTLWDARHRLAVQAGQIVILNGETLKISGLQSGLELTNLADGSKKLIERFSTNLPKELQFPFPAGVAAGTYSVTLKTYFRSGTDYATQQTALLALEFSVT
ncbi:MAG: DUF4469 domain-containing protein [Spirochaetota bacterium]